MGERGIFSSLFFIWKGCPYFGPERLEKVLSASQLGLPCLLLTRLIWRQLVQVCIEFLMRKIATGKISLRVALGGKSECAFLFFSARREGKASALSA